MTSAACIQQLMLRTNLRLASRRRCNTHNTTIDLHRGEQRYYFTSFAHQLKLQLPFAQIIVDATRQFVAGSGPRCQTHSISSLLSGKEYQYIWHDPLFMKDCQPETVEQWLASLLKSNRHQKEDASSSNHNLDINVDSIAYLRVLEAYSKSKIGGAPQKAEYWIGQLERQYAQSAKSYLQKYSSVSNYESSMTSNEPQCAENIPTSSFPPHVASNSPHNNPDFQKNTSSAEDKHASIVRSLQPTVECYNAVIEAWSNDTDRVSVIRSRRWLSKLEDGIECPFPTNHPLYFTLQPDSKSYDLYLHACSRGIGKQQKLLKVRAEEAEELLRYRMSDKAPRTIRPTTESFNYALRAWTRCRNEMCVADRVMNLVREMAAVQRDYMQRKDQSEDDSWTRHISPNTKTYTMAIDAWVVIAVLKASRWHSEQLGLRNKYKLLSRNGETSVIENRERFLERRTKFSDGSEEMENAHAILKYIQTLESTGRADINATVVGYNTLLSGWARIANEMRPEIPRKSEAILRDMMELYENGNENAAPDVMTFNAVIKAWGATKRPNSAARCEWWLRKMISESKDGRGEQGKTSTPKPNVNTYNLVMEAFLQLGDAARCQDLLFEMDADLDLSPNSESFSKVIRAWMHDEMNNRHEYGLSGQSCENAFRWLEELLKREKACDSGLGPAPDMFTGLLKTAAKTKSRGENILTIGQKTFWAMRESRFGVNALAYEWVLEIGLKVLSSPEKHDRREQFVMSLLKQVCKDGFLSPKFISMLRSLEAEERSFMKEGEEKMFNKYLAQPPFPATWNRNVLCGHSFHK